MATNQIEPNGLCSKATRNLQRCLIEEGNRLAESRRYEQALVTLFHAYSLLPGVTPVLHAISEVYEACGDVDSAMACRRGVIPEVAEERYFNAQLTTSRIIASRKASKSHHVTTHKPQHVKLHTPRSNHTPQTRPEFRAKKTESRGSFVSVLDDAGFWFDGFNTVVTDSRRRILKEHIKGNAYLVADVAKLRPEEYVDATVCFMDARSSSIYYHWMIDVLPKFAVLKKAGIDLHTIDYFVVRCHSEFQKHTLIHLGIPAEKIMEPCNTRTTRCKQLIVPYLKHDRGDRFYNGLGLGMAQWVPDWLRSTFVKASTAKTNRIYISRASRGTRSPVEETTLIDELGARGFSSVALETLSVVEQANLMAGADIVVAPHGAGLTNIAFCRPGTTVVEIFGNYVVPCYWALSELANLDYHAYFVNDQGNPLSAQNKAKSLSARRDQSIDLEVGTFLTYIDNLEMTSTLPSASSA